MIKQQFLVFLLRWITSSFGIFLCISWFGQVNDFINTCPDGSQCIAGGHPNPLIGPDAWGYYVVAGLVFSLANSFIKPLAKMMILPLVILTMGISTLFLNLGMVWLALGVLPGVSMGLWGIIGTSLVLSLINSLVNLAVPTYNK